MEFKRAVVQELQQAGYTVTLCHGEADLAIRTRSQELLSQGQEFVVVGNDCDYAIHPGIPTLLRP
ncbi:hypothetical protein BGW41_007508, partial [Actinomortierella wolfii]